MPVARVPNSCLVILSNLLRQMPYDQADGRLALVDCNCFLSPRSVFGLVHRCVPQQSLILCWPVYLIDDVVLVEIEDKQKHTGFLSHRQSPGFSVCFVVVNN